MIVSPKNTYLVFRIQNHKAKLDNICSDRQIALEYCLSQIKQNKDIELHLFEDLYHTIVKFSRDINYMEKMFEVYELD